MKRILFILIGPRRIASSRVRVLTHVPRLLRDLSATSVTYVAGSTMDASLPAPVAWMCGVILKRIRAARIRWILRNPGAFDLVFVHRHLLREEEVDAIKSSGARLIFDFDDALTIEGFLPEATARGRFEHIIRHADAVLTSTRINADAVRSIAKKVEVVPSAIDLSLVGEVRRHDSRDPVTIGWIGSPSTQKYMNLVSRPLAHMANVHGAVIRTIGADHRWLLEGVRTSNVAWNERTEYDELGRCDIGIMPLPDEPWTRGKAGFKLLQYMAKGLPVVASPVGVNPELVMNDRNGFLAATDDEWIDALERLASSAELRARLGRSGRHLIESTYASEIAYETIHRVIREVLT